MRWKSRNGAGSIGVGRVKIIRRSEAALSSPRYNVRCVYVTALFVGFVENYRFIRLSVTRCSSLDSLPIGLTCFFVLASGQFFGYTPNPSLRYVTDTRRYTDAADGHRSPTVPFQSPAHRSTCVSYSLYPSLQENGTSWRLSVMVLASARSDDVLPRTGST